MAKSSKELKISVEMLFAASRNYTVSYSISRRMWGIVLIEPYYTFMAYVRFYVLSPSPQPLSQGVLVQFCVPWPDTVQYNDGSLTHQNSTRNRGRLA